MQNKMLILASTIVGSGIFAIPPAIAGQERDAIVVSSQLSHKLLKHGAKQRVYLKIRIRGREQEAETSRTPANVAIVIDRSGSMNGEKIRKAREAAKMAVDRMVENDYASVVIFDHDVEALVSARPVKHREYFHSAIDQIIARGQTAIYPAIEMGAQQIARNKSPQRLNRIILISDGLANVGPSRPHDFQLLGERLGRKGISVSTIGLGRGYNEDLMSQLALASDGNHAFARTGADLVKIFNQEFDEVLSVSCQDVEIIIHTRKGVAPVEILGRKGVLEGNSVRFKLNQIYGSAEHALLVALDVDGETVDNIAPLADIRVNYLPPTGGTRHIETAVNGQFSRSDSAVRDSTDPEVMKTVLELQARNRSREAIRLRDSGKIKEAASLLRSNAEDLDKDRIKYRIESKRLQTIIQNTKAAAEAAPSPRQWNASRKQMREDLSNRQGSSVKY